MRDFDDTWGVAVNTDPLSRYTKIEQQIRMSDSQHAAKTAAVTSEMWTQMKQFSAKKLSKVRAAHVVGDRIYPHKVLIPHNHMMWTQLRVRAALQVVARLNNAESAVKLAGDHWSLLSTSRHTIKDMLLKIIVE